MKSMTPSGTWIAAAALCGILSIWAPETALADTLTPQQIVQKMQNTISGFEDQTMEVTMTVKGVDGSTKSYDFTTRQKGTSKRLVRFTSGEMKGMATLVEGRSRVYVYLPGYKKVRRVASHAMNQSFAGSDFTTEDMASLDWVSLYDVALLKEDASHWYLNCKAKPDKKVSYSRVVLKVDKKDFQQDGIEYYDGDGKLVKTMENSHPKKYANGRTRNSVVIVTDVRTGHSTRLDIKDFRVNEGLPDSMFTVRQLQWGR
ncbi:MAG: outer membrane lipoprotein-sorting protein [Deltaproteobacteria bacterium]|nr:outer membrane lipoprotein-sorting protein [Deltaproteobacteria bacterium]